MQVYYFHYVHWVCLAAYAIHLLEELTFDWRGWANKTLGLAQDSRQFYYVNATTMSLGLCCAMIGWSMPTIALMFPALMIINGLFFHILPAITQKRLAPGFFTSLLVLLPAGGLSFYAAQRVEVLDSRALVISFAGAIVYAGYVLILSKMEKRWKFNG